MSRKPILALVASLLLITSATAPAAALSLGGNSGPSLDQVENGAVAQPSWVVELENSSTSADALRDWTDATDNRRLIALDNDSKTATVAAPRWSVNAGFFGQLGASVSSVSLRALTSPQLAEQDFIRAIHPNYQHEVSPVDDLMSAEEYSSPQVGSFAFDDPEFSTDGLAFSEDANKTTMAEVRETIGADGISANGAGITIGHVDSGGNLADGEIAGNGTEGSDVRVLNASKSFISNETIARNGTDAIEDENGHGSWVQGALIGNPNGSTHDAPASEANALALKALNAEGSGSTSDIAAAIRYAADNDVDVLSLSLGSPIYDEAIADSIRYAYDNGVKAIVVAAGNSRMTRSPGLGSPADMPPVIAVGATNGSTNTSNSASAYFSQYSGHQAADGNASNEERIDVVAPGMKTTVKAASTDGFPKNSTLSGTSMATPIVASGIAEAMSANATLAEMDHEELHDAVTASAEPVPNLATAEAGHGMFNVRNLIEGTHPEQSQDDAMDSGAQQRQTTYEALDAPDSTIARIADVIGA